MFTAKVYRVMIGSLSGAMEEVYLAKEIIRKWNQNNAESKGRLFMPVEWSTKTEELNKADIVIGIIGNWIDNTAVVEECALMGKKVILFFQTCYDPKVTIPGEVQKIEEYKEQKKDTCPCFNYDSTSAFDGVISKQIMEYAINNLTT